MVTRCKKWLVGIVVLLCGAVCGSAPCFAEETVDGNLVNCIKNGYYNASVDISTSTYIKDVLTEIYGVCNYCAYYRKNSAWFIGVWPTGSSTNPYDYRISLDKLSTNVPVYLWSQALICGFRESDYQQKYRKMYFTDTGYHANSFPFIDQGNNVSSWSNLSRTVSGKYGSNNYSKWGVYGSPKSATFNAVKFAGSPKIIPKRYDRGDYYALSYPFRSSFVAGDCRDCVITSAMGYDGVSAFDISAEARQTALIGIAIDYNGENIDSMNTKDGTVVGNIMEESLVEYDPVNGSLASIKSATPTGDYKFVGWRSGRNGEIISTNTTYSSTIKRVTTVYAVYQEDNIFGKIELDNDADCIDINTMTSVSILDYTQSDRVTRCTIHECDSLTGCEIKFSHYLKGTGSPNYVISNYRYGFTPSSLKNSNDGIDSVNGTRVYYHSVTLYPGDVYHETLEFSPYLGKTVKLDLSASIEGYIQPAPY